MVVALAVSLIAAIWGGVQTYSSLSDYWSSEAQARRQRAKEIAEDAEAEKAKAAAARMPEEAKALRQLYVAKMQADVYQWKTWQHTLRDIEENAKRLKEKQRIAAAEAAAADRLEKIQQAKKDKEAQQKAAEMAARPRSSAQIRVKKTLRSF